MSGKDNEVEWNQFCKLGEMMGDGLHNEPDGKWITKDYNRLAKILIPELKEESKERRRLKAISIDSQMVKLIEKIKCSCGGNLKQARSGSKVAYCQNEDCKKRYKANKKK